MRTVTEDGSKKKFELVTLYLIITLPLLPFTIFYLFTIIYIFCHIHHYPFKKKKLTTDLIELEIKSKKGPNRMAQY